MAVVYLVGKDACDAVLTWDICIDAVQSAAIALSSGAAEAPLRSFLQMEDGHGTLAIMPSSIPSAQLLGVKAITIMNSNGSTGRPSIQGLIALFCQDGGELIGLVDGASITTMRTAAASALATRVLGKPMPERHGIVGTGVQALSHAKAIQAACPTILETLIWGRDANAASRIARRLLDDGIEARPCALADFYHCDVISTVTASKHPILDLEHLRPGVHLNLVGSHTPDAREVSSQAIVRSSLFVDYRSASLKEAGDILIPISQKLITADHISAEIGEVLLRLKPGRQNEREMTIYKSLGNGVQDMFAANSALVAAQKAGLAVQIKF